MSTESAKPLPPKEIIDSVRRRVMALEVLTRARRTDLLFHGEGRYEAEAYLNHKDLVDCALDAIDKFEQLCEKYLIDTATIYALTGEPARLSQDAKDWLESLSPAPDRNSPEPSLAD